MSQPSPSEARAGVRAEIERRLAARRTDRDAAVAAARRLSNARLAIFVLGVAMAVVALTTGRLDPRWLVAPAAVFGGLVVAHDRVLRRRAERERSVRWYEDAAARLDHTFAGRGNAGERFRDPEHPYADDLDCFGAGGLFELLCRARTAAGEALLASWLLAPAPPDEVRARQAAVAELRDLPDLRESLSLVGDTVAGGLHAEALVRWGESAARAPGASIRVAAAALGAISAGLLAATLAGLPLLIPWLATLGVALVVATLLRRRVRGAIAACEAPARDLALLARLLAVLEGVEPKAPRLVALRQAVATDGVAASKRIARLGRLVELLDARRNQLFAPVGAVLLYTTQIALAIEAWRARCGPSLRAWIGAVAELEALASLATHAWEHPDDVFPELVGGAARFEAEAAGHPLIPEDTCVRNDVQLGEAPRVLLVSGSNMSGKSTLLRTVGVAAVLAQAGAPVRARRLRLSPLAVGASLRVFDSLQAGHSHFYAEIRRLRAIVALTEPAPPRARDAEHRTPAPGPVHPEGPGVRPLLFLLDEILHGTNSHDRRIGAEAVIRTLVARDAIGVVTTHDLALAKIADDLGPRAVNVHFEDQVIEGRMHFDYRMHPGVVRRSNALELMRAVGLDV